MKTTTLLLFIVISTLNIRAQTFTHGFDCLGIHCYVTVNLRTDPVTSDGYLKYTISTPPESIYDVQGPAAVLLSNYLGGTIDLYIRKSQLELAAADRDQCEIPFELLVDKWKDEWGNPSTSGIRCHYHIILMINNNIL
jgi:hypothetical protein